MIVICIIGPTASGKGTQASLLSKSLHIPHITVGHILREMSEEATPMGKRLKRLIDSGIAISSDVLRPIMVEVFKTYRQRGVILDGFPRTREQAELLINLKNNQQSFKKLLVIVLKLPDKEIIKRAKDRLRKPGYVMQVDDDLSIVKDKLMLYHLQKEFIEKAILKEYQAGRGTEYFEVESTSTIEKVHDQILNYIKETINYYKKTSQ